MWQGIDSATRDVLQREGPVQMRSAAQRLKEQFGDDPASGDEEPPQSPKLGDG